MSGQSLTKIRHLNLSGDISCSFNFFVFTIYCSCVRNKIIRVIFFFDKFKDCKFVEKCERSSSKVCKSKFTTWSKFEIVGLFGRTSRALPVQAFLEIVALMFRPPRFDNLLKILSYLRKNMQQRCNILDHRGILLLI